jgi:hypothetical protein
MSRSLSTSSPSMALETVTLSRSRQDGVSGSIGTVGLLSVNGSVVIAESNCSGRARWGQAPSGVLC